MSSAAARQTGSSTQPSSINRPLQRLDDARVIPTGSSELHKQRVPDREIDGVYKNQAFTHYLTRLLGSTVEAVVQSGKQFEGVFQIFSPEIEIVLSTVHLIDVNDRDKLPKRKR